MSTLAASGSARPSTYSRIISLVAKLAGSGLILTAALAFVLKYVFRYYFHYNPAAFTDPLLGAANYWNMRGWLLTHITGGMVALLTGPFQFWTGFRMRYANLHRWTGRIFLGGVAVGSVGAYRMAISTTFGWAFGFALLGLATAWFTSAAMALYAILRRQIQVHKEWMVRTYVVTFAFVIFRVLNDYYPGARLQPDGDRGVAMAWACWVIPVLFLEIILQLRKMHRALPSR
ncbi:MAG TPA: DUF2306 domain-containing protein [Candidatus Sulfotelmatobacter sp.]|nr:DUF2306 domain-containing protein [Candidatus Sulfotelmatobacter sp.]